MRWRRLHTEELRNMYPLPNIFRAIKSIRMTWAWHVSSMGGRRSEWKISIGKPEGKGSLEDLGIDRGIILKEIFKKLKAVQGLD